VSARDRLFGEFYFHHFDKIVVSDISGLVREK